MKLKGQAGFTLLEVLIVASIMLMICYIVLKMSSQVVGTWERSAKKISQDNDLILALDIIEKDLETSLPYYWIYNLGHGRIRWCFYSYGKTEFPNAIVYEMGEEGLYRYIESIGRKYDVTEALEEIGMSLKGISAKNVPKLSNRVAKDVKGLTVEFLYINLDGMVEWTKKVPFLGTAISAEIGVMGARNKKLSRRIVLVGVSSL